MFLNSIIQIFNLLIENKLLTIIEVFNYDTCIVFIPVFELLMYCGDMILIKISIDRGSCVGLKK